MVPNDSKSDLPLNFERCFIYSQLPDRSNLATIHNKLRNIGSNALGKEKKVWPAQANTLFFPAPLWSLIFSQMTLISTQNFHCGRAEKLLRDLLPRHNCNSLSHKVRPWYFQPRPKVPWTHLLAGHWYTWDSSESVKKNFCHRASKIYYCKNG